MKEVTSEYDERWSKRKKTPISTVLFNLRSVGFSIFDSQGLNSFRLFIHLDLGFICVKSQLICSPIRSRPTRRKVTPWNIKK